MPKTEQSFFRLACKNAGRYTDFMATPHNAAKVGEIAQTVLLPGDPLRAKHIAENYLQNTRQFTSVRNMLGFTGEWKDPDTAETVTISVMGSGMGGASCGIYSYELYHFYGVKNIIRIGTSGGLQPELNPGDLVFALTSSTDSGWANQYGLPGTYSPSADYLMLESAVSSARKRGYAFHAGGVFSSDCFSEYNALNEITGKNSWAPYARMGILAQDMETYALYSTAAWLGKRALSILTHTDSCVRTTGNEPGMTHVDSMDQVCLPAEKRLSALEPMFRVALDTALSLKD